MTGWRNRPVIASQPMTPRAAATAYQAVALAAMTARQHREQREAVRASLLAGVPATRAKKGF